LQLQSGVFIWAIYDQFDLQFAQVVLMAAQFLFDFEAPFCKAYRLTHLALKTEGSAIESVEKSL
jgi:hypothetical protein